MGYDQQICTLSDFEHHQDFAATDNVAIANEMCTLLQGLYGFDIACYAYKCEPAASVFKLSGGINRTVSLKGFTPYATIDDLQDLESSLGRLLLETDSRKIMVVKSDDLEYFVHLSDY